jgi:aconitate hydratase
MQNVKAVIAVSYERIHRSNLVLFGVMPLQFKEGESAETHGLTGREQFSIDLGDEIRPRMEVNVNVSGGNSFTVILRIDTDSEVTYYKVGSSSSCCCFSLSVGTDLFVVGCRMVVC